jgi:probable rRNA maturation factor
VNSKIRFFSEETNFIFRNKLKTRRWLYDVVREESGFPLNINFIFCSDEYLLSLNKKYLQHDTYTDVLTFPDFTHPNKLSGDVFISIERIKENATKYDQPFNMELARVMVHGLLHLLGYKDKTTKEKELMSLKEDYYLNCFLTF